MSWSEKNADTEGFRQLYSLRTRLGPKKCRWEGGQESSAVAACTIRVNTSAV